jgi:hypothetical protein
MAAGDLYVPVAALDDGQAMSLRQMPECVDRAHGITSK